MKITKVEVQQKHKDRVNVYVDDEFYAGIDMDTCVRHGLKAGMEINIDRLGEIIKESEKQNAFGKAAKYLGKALKTKKQVKDYLKNKGYDEDIIEYCINKLEEYNYINDADYVKAFVHDKGSTTGIVKIKYQLAQKGVSQKIIDLELDEYKSNEDDIIKLLIKKLGNKPKTYDNLSKCMAYLSNRGFEYDDIKKAINTLKRGEIDESWD